MNYIITQNGQAVTAVLNSWDAVLDFFNGLHRHEERVLFDIIELGTVRIMTDWVSKDDNGASLKQG